MWPCSQGFALTVCQMREPGLGAECGQKPTLGTQLNIAGTLPATRGPRGMPVQAELGGVLQAHNIGSRPGAGLADTGGGPCGPGWAVPTPWEQGAGGTQATCRPHPGFSKPNPSEPEKEGSVPVGEVPVHLLRNVIPESSLLSTYYVPREWAEGSQEEAGGSRLEGKTGPREGGWRAPGHTASQACRCGCQAHARRPQPPLGLRTVSQGYTCSSKCQGQAKLSSCHWLVTCTHTYRPGLTRWKLQPGKPPVQVCAHSARSDGRYGILRRPGTFCASVLETQGSVATEMAGSKQSPEPSVLRGPLGENAPCLEPWTARPAPAQHPYPSRQGGSDQRVVGSPPSVGAALWGYALALLGRRGWALTVCPGLDGQHPPSAAHQALPPASQRGQCFLGPAKAWALGYTACLPALLSPLPAPRPGAGGGGWVPDQGGREGAGSHQFSPCSARAPTSHVVVAPGGGRKRPPPPLAAALGPRPARGPPPRRPRGGVLPPSRGSGEGARPRRRRWRRLRLGWLPPRGREAAVSLAPRHPPPPAANPHPGWGEGDANYPGSGSARLPHARARPALGRASPGLPASRGRPGRRPPRGAPGGGPPEAGGRGEGGWGRLHNQAGRGPEAGRGPARGPRSRKPGTATGPRRGEPGSRPRPHAGRARPRGAPRQPPAPIGWPSRRSPPLLRTAPARGPPSAAGAAHPGNSPLPLPRSPRSPKSHAPGWAGGLAHEPMHFAPDRPSRAAPSPRARDPGRLQPPGSWQPPPPRKLGDSPRISPPQRAGWAQRPRPVPACTGSPGPRQAPTYLAGPGRGARGRGPGWELGSGPLASGVWALAGSLARLPLALRLAPAAAAASLPLHPPPRPAWSLEQARQVPSCHVSALPWGFARCAGEPGRLVGFVKFTGGVRPAPSAPPPPLTSPPRAAALCQRAGCGGARAVPPTPGAWHGGSGGGEGCAHGEDARGRGARWARPRGLGLRARRPSVSPASPRSRGALLNDGLARRGALNATANLPSRDYIKESPPPAAPGA
ncbi:collagen alpha-1(I) chain-like [Loxodonta africana]|uniref:collagen alpha-1(I) chain-like n=1 Tax=Loxodonta africana TaxID=9785 RepID=UPI0030D4E0CF